MLPWPHGLCGVRGVYIKIYIRWKRDVREQRLTHSRRHWISMASRILYMVYIYRTPWAMLPPLSLFSAISRTAVHLVAGRYEHKNNILADPMEVDFECAQNVVVSKIEREPIHIYIYICILERCTNNTRPQSRAKSSLAVASPAQPSIFIMYSRCAHIMWIIFFRYVFLHSFLLLLFLECAVGVVNARVESNKTSEKLTYIYSYIVHCWSGRYIYRVI